jgi:hypothetical protein
MASNDDFPKTPQNDSFISNLTGYLDTRIDRVRLEVQEKVKDIFIGTLHGATLATLGLLALVFVSIFAGLALNHVLNSSFWGFGIVAGVYVLLLVLVFIGLDKSAFQGLANKLFKDTIYKSDKRQA